MSKKILIYEPFILWYHHFVTSLEIALTHINNKDEVYFLACKSNFSTCHLNLEHDLNICTSCNIHLLNGLNKIDFNINNLIYMDLEEYKENIEIPVFKDLDEFKNFEIDGIDFGQAAYSSLVNLIREPFPDIKKYNELINKMLIDEIAIYKYTSNFLNKNKYDIVYLFNGRYSTQRPFLRAAQKQKIKVITHERGGILENYALVENTYIHDLNYLKEDYYRVWDDNLNHEKKKKIAEEYYLKRLKGWGGSFYSFIDNQKEGKLPENFDKDKYNIVIFNSSEDEYIGFKEYSNNLYTKEIEAFENIIKSTKDKNVHYYLRVHPNLKNLNNSQIKAINNLKYKNLTIIPAESDISTYDLMKACNKVITTASTTGVEANFFGKVVISLGVTSFDSLNIAYKPKTYKETIELIEDRKLKPLSNEGSLIFAYWSIKRGIKFKYYNPEQVNGGKFLGEYIEYDINHNTLVDILERIFYSNFKPIEKQDDLVSVIMPAYNSEKTLYKSAISILKQSYKNLELIIINDGSKDNTEKIAKSLVKKDNRVIYIKQDNKGVASARNKGISIARGKYIKLLDSDDFLFINSIELLVSEIKKNNSTKIVFGNYIINSYGNIELSSIDKIQIDRNTFLIKQLIGNLIASGTVLIEKSILNETGYFNENIRGPEDYDLWNRIIQKYNYSYISIPIYIYVYMTYKGEQLTEDIEKLRYYTDIAANRLLSSIDLKDLFSNYSDNINDIPTLIDNLIEKMLKRTDTCYDTILKLIDKAQEISYSKNRDNKKIELFNDNNIRGINYIKNLYNNLKSNINIDFYNKLSLNKFFFIKDNEIIRYFYQNTYLNFTTENNNRIISSSWYLSIIDKDIIDYINNHIDLLLVPSQFVLENISNLGVLEDKIKILNEFIDYDIFKQLDIEKYNDFTFIYSGKIDYISGIDILIEVFKDEFKNENTKLIIHCNGIYDIDYLENLKKQLSDNIQIILDNFSDNELNEFINKAHCFVYPYRLEGSLSNILKPIASNIPIIITNNCISKDLPKELINTIDCNFIIDKNILLGDIETIGTFSYYEADKNSLKSKMKDIYSNYDNNINNSTKLRKYILDNYSKEKSINNLNKYIDEINKEIAINNNLDNYKDLLYQKGKEYFNNKDYRKAEQYFNLLISYDKKVNYYLALSLYYQGKYEKSIEYFVNSITSKFIDYEILNSLSDSLYKMGDIKTSNYYKQKALSIK